MFVAKPTTKADGTSDLFKWDLYAATASPSLALRSLVLTRPTIRRSQQDPSEAEVGVVPSATLWYDGVHRGLPAEAADGQIQQDRRPAALPPQCLHARRRVLVNRQSGGVHPRVRQGAHGSRASPSGTCCARCKSSSTSPNHARPVATRKVRAPPLPKASTQSTCQPRRLSRARSLALRLRGTLLPVPPPPAPPPPYTDALLHTTPCRPPVHAAASSAPTSPSMSAASRSRSPSASPSSDE